MAYDRNELRVVSPVRHERLKHWSERKPCVALMGEFSAGKSTLLNFLIGEDLLPTKAIATELPPVWFTYGTGACHWIDEDGNRHGMDIADLARVPIEARYARIYTNAELLEHCDVIDTPGISDPNLARDSWRMAAAQANLVLWCTTATQAWRETERGAWLSLPERLRKHSLLVVTRADKLTVQADRDKVARRLNRETADLFSGTVFMSTPEAVRARAELGDAETSPLWESSGAANLLGRLGERFQAVYAERAAMFERYVVEGSDAAKLVSAKAAGQAGLMPTRPVRPVGDRSRRSERPSPEDVDDWLQRASDAMEAAGPAPFVPVGRDMLMPGPRPLEEDAPMSERAHAAPPMAEPEIEAEIEAEDVSATMEIVEAAEFEEEAPAAAGTETPPTFEIEIEDAEIVEPTPFARGAEVIPFGMQPPAAAAEETAAGEGVAFVPGEGHGEEATADEEAVFAETTAFQAEIDDTDDAAEDSADAIDTTAGAWLDTTADDEDAAEIAAEVAAEATYDAEATPGAQAEIAAGARYGIHDEAAHQSYEAPDEEPEEALATAGGAEEPEAAQHAAAHDDAPAGHDDQAGEVEAEAEDAEALATAGDIEDAEEETPVDPVMPEREQAAARDAMAADFRGPTAPYILRARDRAEPTGAAARPVTIWREIAARHPAAPTGADVVAMIDAFLVELYRTEDVGAEAAVLAAAAAGLAASDEAPEVAVETTASGGTAAASLWDDDLDGRDDDDDAPGPHDGSPGSGWRRLA